MFELGIHHKCRHVGPKDKVRPLEVFFKPDITTASLTRVQTQLQNVHLVILTIIYLIQYDILSDFRSFPIMGSYLIKVCLKLLPSSEINWSF